MTRFTAFWFPLLLMLCGASQAASPFWRCEPLSPLAPLSVESDVARERAYCAIDFAGGSTAICPKTWSTSPGAVLYDLAGTAWAGRAAEFEVQHCGPGGNARDVASRELTLFKNTLNGRETSGTFAPASLLYYHLSRLLQTRTQVPVAVPVSFDVPRYRARIVEPGLNYSADGSRRMLHAGWLEMDAAMAAPGDYPHARELFIANGSRLWGVFLLPEGRRYGAEFNGTRESGWGEGQNRDFQRTAPFLALRTDAPLDEAVQQGIAEARRDPAMATALAEGVSAAQVAWWMHELTEIVLLDFILGQQDRIGNVDYVKRWVWMLDGRLHSAERRPDSAAAHLLRRSVLNDNDAGARSGYANYARSTGMLEGWHHMDADLYRRLQSLASDFEANGPLAAAIRQRYRLSARESDRIITRGREAAAILARRCAAGELRFDLGPADVLDPAGAVAAAPPCRVSPAE